MKYLSSAIISTVSILAFAAIAGSANAAGISFSSTLGPASDLSSFDDGTADGFTFELNGLSAASNIKSGSSPFSNLQNLAPLGDTSKYLVVQPSNVSQSSLPSFTLGAVIYKSPTLLNTLSIYWGSADPSNQVEFFNGSSPLAFHTLTGADVFGADANGDSTSPASNRYVTFTANDPSYRFDKVRFSTGQIAFEFEQKRPVPVPAIVPGIALAAVFFGSKVLKDKQKVTNSLVA